MDPAFHFDVVSYPDPTQVSHIFENDVFLPGTSFHSSASIYCFIFLVSVIDVIFYKYFVQYTEIFWKKKVESRRIQN